MGNLFVEKLTGYGLLNDVDKTLLDTICQNARHFPARHDLIREGDEPGPVFVMVEGWGCRYKLVPDGGRQIVAFLMPGDFCDMHAGILREMDHSIGTLTPALVCTISRERMEELTEKHPRIAQAFWWTQLVDEGVLRAWIVSMGRRDAIQRISHLVCELYMRMHSIGIAEHERCAMPLTQIVLADALGLTPIHVNRVLRTLREDNVMDFHGGELIVHDPVRLAQIAGFDETYLHRRLRRAA